MKLTNLKNLIEKMPQLKQKLSEATDAYQNNPENKILKNKYDLASTRWKRANKTINNYSPTFSVSLGMLSDCTKEVFDSLGLKSELECNNFKTENDTKPQADVTLILNDNIKYNLFKVDLEKENQPLKDVNVNLLKTDMLKGNNENLEDKEVENILDIIAWNAITKTLLEKIEEKKIAKAIKEEEKLSKI